MGIKSLTKNKIQALLLLFFDILSVIIWNGSWILRNTEFISYTIQMLVMVIILPLTFLLMVMLFDNKIQFLKHIIGYPVLLYFYSGYIFLYVLGISHLIHFEPIEQHANKLNNIEKYFEYGYYASFPFITTLVSIVIAWFEKVAISIKNIWILTLTTFFIPTIAFFMTITIYHILKFSNLEVTLPTNSVYNPAYWFTNGGLQFSYILYFGVYLLYLRSKKNNFFASNTKSVSQLTPCP